MNRVQLGEVAHVRSGYAFSSQAWTREGYRVVKIANVKSGRLDFTANVSFVSADVAVASGFILEPGQLVVGMTGDVGQVARVAEADGLIVLNQRVGLVTVNSDLVDPDYLFVAIRTEGFRKAAVSLAHGSVQPNISPKLLESIEIPLPPLADQRAIAATLGALDDKIDSNRRLIDLIPSLISAHVTRATAGDSEVIPISSLATFVNGGAYTKGATGTGRMVLRIAELNKGPGSSTVYNDIDVPDDKLARPGDILMSWSGSLGVYRWVREEAIVNQHIFKVIPRDYPEWLVFDRLEEVMPIFRGHAADKATTMGHIQRGHLDSTQVEIPGRAVRIELDRTLSPLWQRLLLAEREALGLEQLRDALLPELLSGRTRVGESAA